MRRVAVVLLAGLLAGCGEGEPGAPAASAAPAAPAAGPSAGAAKGHDVLVILLDALHAEHLSCHGAQRRTSPNVDALAARGVRFARAWSQTTWTLASTASLMTSLYQESHGVRHSDEALPDGAETLAEAFAAAGWETACFTQNPFASGAFGLGQGFGAVHEFFGSEHTEAEFVDAAAAFMAPRPGRAPRMAYVHFRRPHAPYDPPEPWRSQFADADYPGTATGTHKEITDHNTARRPLSAADIEQLRDLYEGGLAVVDADVGQLLRAADPGALVVVVSDHGEGFGQHGRLGHNGTVFEEIVNIAMVFAGPGVTPGRVVGAPVMSIDVFPTLAELCGLKLPAAAQGRSLGPQLAGSAEVPHELVFTSSREDAPDHAQAVFDGRWKLHRVPESRLELLFDLVADPGEKHDLAGAYPKPVARLRQGLDRWLEAQGSVRGPAAVAADRRLTDQLRALGYVGDR